MGVTQGPVPGGNARTPSRTLAGMSAVEMPGASEARLGVGTWVVVPTYNEAENLRPIASAILAALPGVHLLIVDDSSPDGTGEMADALAAIDERVSVCHRRKKQGIGRAYLDGFRQALDAGARVIVQMDADFSHDPGTLPRLIAPIDAGSADLVLGSRYVRGGSVVNWGIARKLISRGGSIYARTVLGISPWDLTGGFKAWRASTLAAVPFTNVHAGGYVFQIEMTWHAIRTGARVIEIPITFPDRRLGQSKMSRRIIAEALLVVIELRFDELRSRWSRRRRARD